MPHTTLQVTPLLPEGPLTIAVNGCVPPKGTTAELGDTEIAVAGMVIVATANAAVLNVDVAVRLTVRSLGSVATGAV